MKISLIVYSVYISQLELGSLVGLLKMHPSFGHRKFDRQADLEKTSVGSLSYGETNPNLAMTKHHVFTVVIHRSI